jgi:hypothetical protein
MPTLYRLCPYVAVTLLYDAQHRYRGSRATASIYCYPYNKTTGKTMTRYVGSFRVDLDPDAVPRGVELQPGERQAGITTAVQRGYGHGGRRRGELSAAGCDAADPLPCL